MLLNFNPNQNNWLLYGRNINKQVLIGYQHHLRNTLIIVNTWHVDDYYMIKLSGHLTSSAIKLAYDIGFDVAPLYNIPLLEKPGLLIMDMDSTMIQIECINEIAKLAGYGNQVAEITEKAMRGEIDFEVSLRERVAILAGTNVNILKQVLNRLILNPGLINLVYKLRNLGWKIAIASSGFKFYADYLSYKLKLDAAFANELEIHNGKLTGQILGEIVNAQFKANILRYLAQYFNIELDQTVAIGDGANDLLMIKTAALGIAYHPKPEIDLQTKIKIHYADLMGVFYILSNSYNS